MAIIKTIEVDGVVYEVYDEGARALMVVKASGLPTGVVYDYIVNASGTTTTRISPIVAGTGASSLMQQSLPLTGESAGFRANTVLGNFSAAFGTRNIVGAKSSEALVAGGLLEDYGQNNFVFGNRSKSYVNQNLTGGYKCTNKASESIQVGNQLTIDGTITVEADGTPTSDSKHNAQFGKSNTMGVATQGCFMAGEGISQGDGGLYNSVTGKGHTIDINLKYSRICGWNSSIGKSCDDIDVFGYGNNIGKYVQNSLVSGKQNTVTDGSSSHKKTGIYILGDNCSNNGYSNFYGFGKGLRPVEAFQIVIGSYNVGTPNAWFEVGCGSSDGERATAFAVCQSGSNKWIKIGGTELSETQLQALLALIA